MQINLVSHNLQNQLLTSLPGIPGNISEHLLPNSERNFYCTNDFEYLEQRYVSEGAIVCELDIIASANFTVPSPSNHSILVLLYVLEGSALCTLRGVEDVEIRRDQAYLFYVPATTILHADFKKGYHRIMYCAITETCLENAANDHPGANELLNMFVKGIPARLTGKPVIITRDRPHQMWFAEQYHKGQSDETNTFKQPYLNELCVDLVLDYIKQSKSDKNSRKQSGYRTILRHEKILEAKRMIDDGEDGKMSIAFIAKKVGLTEQRLKNLFKQTFKATIGKYQIEIRFTKACKLLKETDMYISAIAFIIGYEDESSLTRLFNQKLKMTPQQFRMQSRHVPEKRNCTP